MGKINSGILGTITGKVGGVVGRTWKGINTVAAYQPNVTNPQTAAQIEQRSKMTLVTEMASKINTAVIKPLWDRFAKGMSGYNDFVSNNIAFQMASEDFVYTIARLSSGKMVAVIPTVTGILHNAVTVNWSTDLPDAYSLATDEVYIVVLDRKDGSITYSAAEVQRSAGTKDMTFAASAGNKVSVIIAFRRQDGTIVSDSGQTYFTAV